MYFFYHHAYIIVFCVVQFIVVLGEGHDCRGADRHLAQCPFSRCCCHTRHLDKAEAKRWAAEEEAAVAAAAVAAAAARAEAEKRARAEAERRAAGEKEVAAAADAAARAQAYKRARTELEW